MPPGPGRAMPITGETSISSQPIDVLDDEPELPSRSEKASLAVGVLRTEVRGVGVEGGSVSVFISVVIQRASARRSGADRAL